MAMRYSHLAPDFRMDAVQRMQKKFEAKKRKVNGAKSGTKSGTQDLKEQTSVH